MSFRPFDKVFQISILSSLTLHNLVMVVLSVGFYDASSCKIKNHVRNKYAAKSLRKKQTLEANIG